MIEKQIGEKQGAFRSERRCKSDFYTEENENVLRRFGYAEKVDRSRLAKRICRAGNVSNQLAFKPIKKID